MQDLPGNTDLCGTRSEIASVTNKKKKKTRENF